MKKKKILEKIFELDLIHFCFLEKKNPLFIKYMEALRHEQFHSVEFSYGFGSCSYDNEACINIFIQRDETNEEFKIRIAKTERRKEAAKRAAITREKKREEKELEQLKKLKEKYEKKT